MPNDGPPDRAEASAAIPEPKLENNTDGAEAIVDNLEDTLSAAIQPVLAVKALYEANSDAIHEATKALATIGGGSGRAIEDWVGVVDKVIGGLDELAQSTGFPFVGAAVFLFKGVVKLETQRRQNSGRSRALILQMADMMGVLLQLSSVRDPGLKDERTGQTIVGRVQALIVNIETDIKDSGNLIDTYAKHSLPSKFFFSGQYADKFKARAESLVNRKGEIVFALQIHNTIGIDTIQAGMRENNAMLAKLISIIDHHSERNEDLDRMMRDLGGRNKVLGNDELLTTMASAVQARQGNKDDRAKSAVKDGAKFSGKEDAVLSAAERHELRFPLDNALEQNTKYYAAKLEAQMSRIASQINHLQSSSDNILKTLNSGPWERVVHPDLRHIWKENGWHTNVRAQLFVMAVHDYFDDLFQSGGSLANGTVGQQSTMTVDPRLRNITAADKWCLPYLTVRYAALLMEVFDADASGFVRIAEVNAFCESIPEGSNLLQWLAYWAEGWKQETAIYSHKIIGLLRRMRSMVGDVLLQNSRVIQQYFQGSAWADLEGILYAAASKFRTSTATPLDKLVKSEMKRKEAAGEQLLRKLSYIIDEPESVRLVSQTPRLEADLLPIAYQILKHHCALIYIARGKTLDHQEFTCAARTLMQVRKVFKFHLEALASTWKLLGFDCHTQFSSYAGGFFDMQANGDADDIFDEDFYEDIDSDIQTMISNASSIKLQFGEWNVDTSGYETAPQLNSLENPSLDPETPLGPIAYTPSVELSVPAEQFVRSVVIRLDGLSADERFHCVKPVAHILREIALAEGERRPARPTRRLILEMADMLSTVLKIRAVEDITLVTDTGESILTRLRSLMLKVERDMKDCGHLINFYHSRGSRRDSSIKKFEDRSEGLQRRKQDIMNTLALPPMKGKILFRAVVRTVVAQIKDNRWRNTWNYIQQRRENRKTYVRLVAKQFECAEIQTIWNVKVSLTPDESRQLQAATSELSHGDLAYYQSLARSQHRSAWVHADRKCDSCSRMPIYGARYLCTVCIDFDLCPECEQKWARGDSDLPDCGHQARHPIVKIARPVIKVDKYAFADLTRIYAHLTAGDDSEGSSGSSMEFSDDGDSDAQEDTDGSNVEMRTNISAPQITIPETTSVLKCSPSHKPWSFSEVETLPQNNAPWGEPSHETEVETPTQVHDSQWPLLAAPSIGGHRDSNTSATSDNGRPEWPSTAGSSGPYTSNDNVMAAASYRCLRCKQYQVGVRFVMTREHRGKHLCPPCEAILSQKHEKGILPDYLRLLLKYSIPPVATRQGATPLVAATTTAVNGAGESITDRERIAALESQVRELVRSLSRLVGAQERHQA